MPRLDDQLAFEQTLRVVGSQPATIFGDASGNDIIFFFVNGVKNRSSREQRDFMLAAAAAEKNSDAKLAHSAYKIFFPKADNANSTARSAVRLCSSITGFTSTISKLNMRPWSAMISMAR